MYSRRIKRIFDVAISIVFLVLFSWLYLILAISVRVNLGSPVIYSARRIGKNNQAFKLYKFRSMTDEKDQSGQLLPDERRLTHFGRILRRSSLDELPEVWNILKGDMSWIGPRPWPVSYLPYFSKKEMQRHSIRPGLSGWAQVNGRTATNWDDRIKYDLDYLQNMSIWMDIIIVFLTLKSIITKSGFVDADEQEDFSAYRKRKTETKE